MRHLVRFIQPMRFFLIKNCVNETLIFDNCISTTAARAVEASAKGAGVKPGGGEKMAKVKLYSNYVKRRNATILDSEKQQEDVIHIVKQALNNGVKEIFFNYNRKGPGKVYTPSPKSANN